MATISQNYTLWLSEAERRREKFSALFFLRRQRLVDDEKLLWQLKRKLSEAKGMNKYRAEIEQKSNQAENKRTKWKLINDDNIH